MQQVAFILLSVISRNFTDEELALLRSMPKHEIEPHETWLAKPPFRPRHVQRRVVFRGEWTSEFGDAEFSVYVRRGLMEARDYSCGIGYRLERRGSLMLARYDGGGHEHREIVDSPHIHWLTADSLSSISIPELEATETDRFDTLESAVYCLIEDFNLSEIDIPPHIRRMFQWH